MAIKYPHIDLTDVDTVFIDLDGTLYDYDECHNAAINHCVETWSQEEDRLPDFSSQDFKKLYEKKRKEVTVRLYPQGACRSRLLAFLSLFEELKIQESYILAKKYNDLYWHTFIDHMIVEPDAISFLQKAHTERKKIVIVTDMLLDIQIMKIERLGIKKFISLLVTSEEAGCEKPSQKIFKYALQKSQADPQRTIMVGDSLDKDVQGAVNAGIKGFWVQKN